MYILRTCENFDDNLFCPAKVCNPSCECEEGYVYDLGLEKRFFFK